MNEWSNDLPPAPMDDPLADLAVAVNAAERSLVARPADELTRMAGKAIDCCIILGIAIPLLVIGSTIGGPVGILICVLAPWVHAAVSASNLTPAGTIGKRLMGCRIMMLNGEPPPRNVIIQRWLTQNGLLYLLLLGSFLVAFIDENLFLAWALGWLAGAILYTVQVILLLVVGSCLHDLATGTCVGYRDRERFGQGRTKAFEVLAPVAVIPFAPVGASSSPPAGPTGTAAAPTGSPDSPAPPAV